MALKLSCTLPRYYEYRLLTKGLHQVGWCSGTFEPQPELDRVHNAYVDHGVGDEPNSYGFDGSRQQLFVAGRPMPYGTVWKQGDVVGCYLDLVGKTISYTLNGKRMVSYNPHITCPAARIFRRSHGATYLQCFLPSQDAVSIAVPTGMVFHAGITLDRKQRGEVVFRPSAFRYPPSDSSFKPLEAISPAEIPQYRREYLAQMKELEEDGDSMLDNDSDGDESSFMSSAIPVLSPSGSRSGTDLGTRMEVLFSAWLRCLDPRCMTGLSSDGLKLMHANGLPDSRAMLVMYGNLRSMSSVLLPLTRPIFRQERWKLWLRSLAEQEKWSMSHFASLLLTLDDAMASDVQVSYICAMVIAGESMCCSYFDSMLLCGWVAPCTAHVAVNQRAKHLASHVLRSWRTRESETIALRRICAALIVRC